MSSSVHATNFRLGTINKLWGGLAAGRYQHKQFLFHSFLKSYLYWYFFYKGYYFITYYLYKEYFNWVLSLLLFRDYVGLRSKRAKYRRFTFARIRRKHVTFWNAARRYAVRTRCWQYSGFGVARRRKYRWYFLRNLKKQMIMFRRRYHNKHFYLRRQNAVKFGQIGLKALRTIAVACYARIKRYVRYGGRKHIARIWHLRFSKWVRSYYVKQVASGFAVSAWSSSPLQGSDSVFFLRNRHKWWANRFSLERIRRRSYRYVRYKFITPYTGFHQIKLRLKGGKRRNLLQLSIKKLKLAGRSKLNKIRLWSISRRIRNQYGRNKLSALWCSSRFKRFRYFRKARRLFKLKTRKQLRRKRRLRLKRLRNWRKECVKHLGLKPLQLDPIYLRYLSFKKQAADEGRNVVKKKCEYIPWVRLQKLKFKRWMRQYNKLKLQHFAAAARRGVRYAWKEPDKIRPPRRFRTGRNFWNRFKRYKRRKNKLYGWRRLPFSEWLARRRYDWLKKYRPPKPYKKKPRLPLKQIWRFMSRFNSRQIRTKHSYLDWRTHGYFTRIAGRRRDLRYYSKLLFLITNKFKSFLSLKYLKPTLCQQQKHVVKRVSADSCRIHKLWRNNITRSLKLSTKRRQKRVTTCRYAGGLPIQAWRGKLEKQQNFYRFHKGWFNSKFTNRSRVGKYIPVSLYLKRKRRRAGVFSLRLHKVYGARYFYEKERKLGNSVEVRNREISQEYVPVIRKWYTGVSRRINKSRKYMTTPRKCFFLATRQKKLLYCRDLEDIHVPRYSFQELPILLRLRRRRRPVLRFFKFRRVKTMPSKRLHLMVSRARPALRYFFPIRSNIRFYEKIRLVLPKIRPTAQLVKELRRKLGKVVAVNDYCYYVGLTQKKDKLISANLLKIRRLSDSIIKGKYRSNQGLVRAKRRGSKIFKSGRRKVRLLKKFQHSNWGPTYALQRDIYLGKRRSRLVKHSLQRKFKLLWIRPLNIPLGKLLFYLSIFRPHWALKSASGTLRLPAVVPVIKSLAKAFLYPDSAKRAIRRSVRRGTIKNKRIKGAISFRKLFIKYIWGGTRWRNRVFFAEVPRSKQFLLPSWRKYPNRRICFRNKIKLFFRLKGLTRLRNDYLKFQDYRKLKKRRLRWRRIRSSIVVSRALHEDEPYSYARAALFRFSRKMPRPIRWLPHNHYQVWKHVLVSSIATDAGMRFLKQDAIKYRAAYRVNRIMGDKVKQAGLLWFFSRLRLNNFRKLYTKSIDGICGNIAYAKKFYSFIPISPITFTTKSRGAVGVYRSYSKLIFPQAKKFLHHVSYKRLQSNLRVTRKVLPTFMFALSFIARCSKSNIQVLYRSLLKRRFARLARFFCYASCFSLLASCKEGDNRRLHLRKAVLLRKKIGHNSRNKRKVHIDWFSHKKIGDRCNWNMKGLVHKRTSKSKHNVRAVLFVKSKIRVKKKVIANLATSLKVAKARKVAIGLREIKALKESLRYYFLQNLPTNSCLQALHAFGYCWTKISCMRRIFRLSKYSRFYFKKRRIRIIKRLKIWLLRKATLLLLSLKFTAFFRTYMLVNLVSMRRLVKVSKLRRLLFKTEVKARAVLWRFPRHKFYEIVRLIRSFVLGLKFGRLGLFMRFLVSLLFSYKRRQGGLLRLYKQIFSKIIRIRNLIGLCFMLRGKLNRRPRSREFEFTFGRQLPLQNLNFNIVYTGRHLITDFGLYSFRTWFYYI